MVQAINRNHSKNTVVTHTDDCFYIYNDELWRKASTNYYKFYDIDIASLNPDDFQLNDYILTYKSISNHIKFSESFKPNECKINDIPVWNIIGLNQLGNEDNYKFPNTGKNAAKFQTHNAETDADTEHSISQLFYTTPNKLIIGSCMIKQISTTTNNLSFQLFNDTYNIGISAKYNLNDSSGYDAYGYKTVPTTFIDNNFNIISSSPVISHLDNITAGIYKIENGEDVYFRLVIKCSCDFSSQMKLKLLILNNTSDYKYTSKQGQSKYLIYTNAFQLEQLDDLLERRPSDYMITTDKSSVLKIFNKLYKIYINPQTSLKEIIEIYNNIYYIYDIKERSEIIPGLGLATYLESFKPSISIPINGDIAIVPSMISFTDYKSSKGNILEDSMVRFGDAFHANNPTNTINYDLINSQYRIKDGNSFKILSYISEEKNKKAIVKAMTFNQGYFETWCKQDRGDRHVLGYNTGGGFNYHRIKRFYPKY